MASAVSRNGGITHDQVMVPTCGGGLVRRDLEGGYLTCTELVNAVTCMRFKLGVCECSVYYIQKYSFFTRDVCFALSFTLVRCIVSETLEKKYYGI